jgi:copper resistance protein B
MMRFALAAVLLSLVVAPASAQDHAGHAGHEQAAPAPPSPAQQSVDPHAGHAIPAEAPPVDHSAMDHSFMDHSAMGHEAPADASPGPTTETPPPPEAGSGPPRAADAIWGPEAMAASRRDLERHHGDFPLLWFQADRAEVQMRDSADGYLWDVQGYYGGTTSRFWFKSEGEGSFGGRVDDAEVQALYSRAITPFFDLQAGVRQDIAGPDTTHAAIGIQGVAPYMFEVDAALFLSHRGDVTARIEGEVDQRITQSLILQPRAEVTLAAQDVPQLGIGAGLDKIELGIRLRYEIRREFAPYFGIEQSWRVGSSADFARSAGEDPSSTKLVAGVRFWF